MTRESFQFPACLGVPDFQGFIPEAEIAVLPSGAIATALPGTMTRESFQFPACLGVPDFQGFIIGSGNRCFTVGCDRHCIYPGTMTRESFQFPACLGVPDFQGFIPEAEIAVLPSGAIATAVTESL
jgi:hypothetical protein